MLKEMRFLILPKRRKIIKLRKRYELIFHGVIEACVQQELFIAVDIKVMTFALLGMMNSIIRWYSVDGETKIEDIAGIFSTLFLNGARRRKDDHDASKRARERGPSEYGSGFRSAVYSNRLLK
jgi:hypothetical protein